MAHKTLHTALSRMTVAALAVLTASCSPPTKPGPIAGELALQSVNPAVGPATGGTELTIRGTGFGAGTTVTVGGRAATEVVVRSADMLTAKTPASSIAGAVDIAVVLNGKAGTLAGGFKYEVTTNNAPIIKSIVAQGKRLRQPANFADYGESIVLTAVVEDLQTAPALLLYQWLTCGGTIVGTGATVEWQIPPSGGLPSTCTVELVVSDGLRVATGTVSVRLHNSAVEVGALARLFLDEFADSTVPAATVVRNFSDSCKGKVDELAQIVINRRDYRILSHAYGTPSVTVGFGGVCPFRSRSADACFRMPAGWISTKVIDGSTEVVTGVSHITGVYRNSEWRLCDSDYGSTSTVAGSTFID